MWIDRMGRMGRMGKVDKMRRVNGLTLINSSAMDSCAWGA